MLINGEKQPDIYLLGHRSNRSISDHTVSEESACDHLRHIEGSMCASKYFLECSV